MKRRYFLKALASLPLVGAAAQIKVANAVETDARAEIESLFPWVHPERGNHSRCATGEYYVTYAIASSKPEAAMQTLINTFYVLGRHCALEKPQGCPVWIADEGPRYLYWRRYPTLEPYQELPDSVIAQVPADRGLWTASARALVSLKRDDGSQDLPPEALRALLDSDALAYRGPLPWSKR